MKKLQGINSGHGGAGGIDGTARMFQRITSHEHTSPNKHQPPNQRWAGAGSIQKAIGFDQWL
jgi:hypothetical protein